MPLLANNSKVRLFQTIGGDNLNLGEVYMTNGIATAIEKNPVFHLEIKRAFYRYMGHDWGDLCQEDIALNEEALKIGERILALYNTSQGKVYIITEWDRSVTTILFADEY